MRRGKLQEVQEPDRSKHSPEKQGDRFVENVTANRFSLKTHKRTM